MTTPNDTPTCDLCGRPDDDLEQCFDCERMVCRMCRMRTLVGAPICDDCWRDREESAE
jgi:hypothetical protein